MRTILIVDDRAENLYLLQALFQGHGFAVQTASNGKEALGLARESPPALVISDILMPVMDGFAFCRAWRSDPKLAAIPFVFLTATYTDGSDEQFALKQGADLFLQKPIDPEQILESVRTLLDRMAPRSVTADLATQPERAYLKEYNEVLVRKLVNKVEELERKNVELARKEKMKSHFLAVAAHELHTPLACVMGYTELLQRQSDSRVVDGLAKGVQRLVSVTRNIILMTKAEAEALPAARAALDLNALIEEHVANIRAFTAHRHQELVFEPCVGKAMVEGDPEELGQAFLNLALNAIRFTPDGGRIVVSIARTELENVVSVSDTGIGIPEEEQERIFEKFYQLKGIKTHHSGTTEFLSGGLGLGLSIARAIAVKHGGSIEVQSRENEGSTFQLKLPKAVPGR